MQIIFLKVHDFLQFNFNHDFSAVHFTGGCSLWDLLCHSTQRAVSGRGIPLLGETHRYGIWRCFHQGMCFLKNAEIYFNVYLMKILLKLYKCYTIYCTLPTADFRCWQNAGKKCHSSRNNCHGNTTTSYGKSPCHPNFIRPHGCK